MICTEDVERCTDGGVTIDPGEAFTSTEKFKAAREMQRRGVKFQIHLRDDVWLPPIGNAEFAFIEGKMYRRAVEKEAEPLSQFGGCVLDLLHARESFKEACEHLANADENLLMFVGNGEARDVELHNVAYRVSNVGGSISITKGE